MPEYFTKNAIREKVYCSSTHGMFSDFYDFLFFEETHLSWQMKNNTFMNIKMNSVSTHLIQQMQTFEFSIYLWNSEIQTNITTKL